TRRSPTTRSRLAAGSCGAGSRGCRSVDGHPDGFLDRHHGAVALLARLDGRHAFGYRPLLFHRPGLRVVTANLDSDFMLHRDALHDGGVDLARLLLVAANPDGRFPLLGDALHNGGVDLASLLLVAAN